MASNGSSQQPPYGQPPYGQSQPQQGYYGQPMPPQSSQTRQPAYPGGPDPYGYLQNPTPTPNYPQSYPQNYTQGQTQVYYQPPPPGPHYQNPPPPQSYQSPPHGYSNPYGPPQGYQQYSLPDYQQGLAQGLAGVHLGSGQEIRNSSVTQPGPSGPTPAHEPPQGVSLTTGDAADRGLIGDAIRKHKKKKKHKSDDESETSSSSSSSSSDSDDSSKKRKKKKKSKTKPSKKATPKYLFSNIADEDNVICFAVKCNDDGSDNLVLNSDRNKVAYSVVFGNNDFTGEIYREGLFGKKGDHQRAQVGAWSEHIWRSEKLKFVFPATQLRQPDLCKWGFNPDKQEFASDIGFLNEAWLQWSVSKKAPDGSYDCAFQCDRVDRTASKAIIWVVMDSYYEARIHTDAAHYKNQEELDEMMVISFAVFDRIRDTCWVDAHQAKIKDNHYKDIKNRRKRQRRESF